MSYTPVDPEAHAARRAVIARGLLPVMERMLEDETFTEISVERLVARARDEGESEGRVSRSSFYNHFEDKGDLLVLMVGDVLAALFETARGWWELGPDPPEQDELLRALRLIADMYHPHRAILGAVVEASSYDARVASAWTGMMKLAADRVREHVVEGQQLGFVNAEIDPDHDPVWIAWMMERGLQQLVATATPAQREQLVMSLRDIVWRTLYAMEG